VTMYDHKFTFTVGDDSGDGHGHRNEHTLECSVSAEALEEMYLKTCGKFTRLDGHHPNTPFAEYEDKELTPVQIQALGLTEEEVESCLYEGKNEDGNYEVWSSEEVVALFVLFMCKHNPGLELREAEGFPSFGSNKLGYFGYGIYD
jgi:hypothetical protein